MTVNLSVRDSARYSALVLLVATVVVIGAVTGGPAVLFSAYDVLQIGFGLLFVALVLAMRTAGIGSNFAKTFWIVGVFGGLIMAGAYLFLATGGLLLTGTRIHSIGGALAGLWLLTEARASPGIAKPAGIVGQAAGIGMIVVLFARFIESSAAEGGAIYAAATFASIVAYIYWAWSMGSSAKGA